MFASKILELDEVRVVVSGLRRRGHFADSLHLVIFRLSACCGLRNKEIRGIDIRDVRTTGPKPHIHIRKEVTKGEKGKRKVRQVPLWWDEETCRDLHAWRLIRLAQTKGDEDAPFVCCQRFGHEGKRMTRNGLSRHWDRTVEQWLGEERARDISIHCGRHSFASLALQAGVSLAAIRDALGHSSLAITDQYVHAIDGGARGIFA